MLKWTQRVRQAFGDFFGWFNSYNTVISQFFDQALFPVILVTYLSHEVPIEGYEPMIKIATIVIITILNIRGINTIFVVSCIFTLLITTPLWLELALQSDYIQPRAWTDVTPEINIGLFVSTMVWLFAGWDNLGTVAGEVKNPQSTYPKGVIAALILDTCVFVVV